MTHKIYEYGHISTAGLETQTTILGTVGEESLAAKQKEIEAANHQTMRWRRPRSCVFVRYFIRPVNDAAKESEGK